MIGQEYFRDRFESEVREAGGEVRAELQLRSGTVYDIVRVQAVEKGHVVLLVYPPAEGESGTRRRPVRPSDSAAAGFDRLVVAYEGIESVHLAPSDRRAGGAVGF